MSSQAEPMIQECIDLQTQIKSLESKLRSLRKELVEYMLENNLDQVTVGNTKVALRSRHTGIIHQSYGPNFRLYTSPKSPHWVCFTTKHS